MTSIHKELSEALGPYDGLSVAPLELADELGYPHKEFAQFLYQMGTSFTEQYLVEELGESVLTPDPEREDLLAIPVAAAAFWGSAFLTGYRLAQMRMKEDIFERNDREGHTGEIS